MEEAKMLICQADEEEELMRGKYLDPHVCIRKDCVAKRFPSAAPAAAPDPDKFQTKSSLCFLIQWSENFHFIVRTFRRSATCEK